MTRLDKHVKETIIPQGCAIRDFSIGGITYKFMYFEDDPLGVVYLAREDAPYIQQAHKTLLANRV